MALECHGNMIKRAEERNDSWGDSVQGRLENCNDPVAEMQYIILTAWLSSGRSACPINGAFFLVITCTS